MSTPWCKLTECLGKPRCGPCLAMDERYPPAAALTAAPSEAERAVIKDLLSAAASWPSCQAGAIERCRCWTCSKERAYALLDAPTAPGQATTAPAVAAELLPPIDLWPFIQAYADARYDWRLDKGWRPLETMVIAERRLRAAMAAPAPMAPGSTSGVASGPGFPLQPPSSASAAIPNAKDVP